MEVRVALLWICVSFKWIFWDGLRFVIVIFSYTFHIKSILFSPLNLRIIHFFHWFLFRPCFFSLCYHKQKDDVILYFNQILTDSKSFWCPKTRYLSTPKCSLLLRKWAINLINVTCLIVVTVCICVTWGRLISILKSPYAELRCRAMSYLYSTWMRTICRIQILLNVLFLRSDILTAKLRVRVNSKIVRFGRVFRIKKNKFALNNFEYVLNVSFSDHSFLHIDLYVCTFSSGRNVVIN